MSKIKFSNLGYNISLMDVTVGKEYEITRFLNEGDFTHNGNRVPANMPGVEFRDDVNDFVAFALGCDGAVHEIIDSEDSEKKEVVEAAVTGLGTITITSRGFNRAFGDTTLNKAYEITRFLSVGDVNSYGTPVLPSAEGVEFIDDVGDVVAYVYNLQNSTYELQSVN